MKSRIKSLLSEKELILNSGMVFGAGFIGAIFLFVSNIVLAKIFGPEVFGNYKTILGLFIFLPALVDFGATPTLTKYIAEFKARKEDGKINQLIRFFLKVKVFSLIAMLSLILLFKDVFANIFLKDPSLSYLIMPGLVLSFFVLFELSKPAIAGFQNFKLFSFSNFLTTASIGIFSVALGYYYGIYYAVLGYGLGYLAGNLPNIWHLIHKKLFHKNGVHLNIMPIIKRYSTPMYGMFLLNMSGNLIIPLLSLFFAQKLIGFYGFAWTFYSGVILIPMALSLVLMPKVSELDAEGKNSESKGKLVKLLVLYTLVVIAGIIGILGFSETIILLISSAYIESVLMFKIILITGLLLGYLRIGIGYATGCGDVKKVVHLTLLMNGLLFIISYGVMTL